MTIVQNSSVNRNARKGHVHYGEGSDRGEHRDVAAECQVWKDKKFLEQAVTHSSR